MLALLLVYLKAYHVVACKLYARVARYRSFLNDYVQKESLRHNGNLISKCLTIGYSFTILTVSVGLFVPRSITGKSSCQRLASLMNIFLVSSFWGVCEILVQ